MSSAGSPNIVFIHAESMDGRKMGCMGHPALRGATPNLDGLAADGVLFRNAYTTCPVCNPSRASMWTGKYPHFRDCWNNHEGLRPGVKTWQDALDSSGYRTAAIGPIDYAHGQHSIRDRIGSWTRAAMIERPLSRTPLPRTVAAGQANGADLGHVDRALQEITAAAGEDRPFWTYLTTALVHPPFVTERNHLDRIDAAAIDLPAAFGLDATAHPAVRYQRITKNCATALPAELVRQIRHSYFAMIAALDDLVGSVLRRVDELGIADSTYVVFASDHGEMAGEQNQILKRSMYEASAHVPLIVRGPGVRRGATVDTPVSLVDLYPTFMEMAGIDYGGFSDQPGYAPELDGESLLPQLTSGAEHRRDWALAEYHGDRACTGTFMLRRDRWKLIRHQGFASQLFDLTVDPDEANDLAGSQGDQLRQMERLLASHVDCGQIDRRAKDYDRESFGRWSAAARADGSYAATMAHVYSGFDLQSIEELRPWTEADQEQVQAWLTNAAAPAGTPPTAAT